MRQRRKKAGSLKGCAVRQQGRRRCMGFGVGKSRIKVPLDLAIAV